ncbi:MAG: S9 family peptidase [Acidobacteria bacterium]|nr:S9 family peptidase [Acidobacteriota bacterium]
MAKRPGLSILRIIILVALVLPLAIASGTAAGAGSVAPAAEGSLFAAGTSSVAPAAEASLPAAGTSSVAPAAEGSLFAAGTKKPVSYDAYNGWRSIQGTQLSRDGQWLVYALVLQDGDGELVALNLKTNKDYRAARGKQPVLTVDGKFVVFTVAPLKADVDKAKKDKKKPEEQPKSGLGIMNLATGEVTTVDRVKSFKVPEESGAFVAYLLEPPLKKPDEKKDEAKKEEAKKEPEVKPEAKKEEAKTEEPKKEEKKKEPGTDFVVRELASSKETKVAEVVDYVWNKPGTWLAYGVSSKTPENDGAFALEAASGKTVALLKGLGNYKNLTFDEKGAQLAFTSDRDDYKSEKSASKLYYWAPSPAAVKLVPAAGKPALAAGATELVPAAGAAKPAAPSEAATELAPAAARNFPAGMAVSENGKPQFSKDGGRLFFGIAAAPKPEPKDAAESVKVDIWNWKDLYLQPMQKAQADEDKKRTLMCVMHLGPKEKKFVPLATTDVPDIALAEDAKVALGSSDLAYRQLVSWDQSYEDIYVVNVNDGSRKKVLEKTPNGARLSPGGAWLFYFNNSDNAWYAYRIADAKTFNLTGKLGVSFDQEVWDSPSEPGPYGTAGWTDGDKSLLVYDRYDIWEISPDGAKSRMITNGVGRRDKLVFRYSRLDPEKTTIPASGPLALQASNEKTRATGAYRVDLAAPTADPVKVVWMDKLFGGLQKSKNADVYVFTQQRFEEFPDLWVSGPDFSSARKVSQANPQQSEYNWGRAELIEYANADGVPLPAVLIKPEDFDPAKKYPLMVYIYETLASGLHRYYPPAPGTSINFTRYISNGYVILMPDIIYEVGYPGSSALKCVIPAVNKVLGMGFIDPKRVGIQGHSWGGYQITYLITQTEMFAAVQAGASVSNMTSAYGGIRWGTGMSRAFQYEKTQSRIGAPLWSRTLQFIENSPIFWVERVKTPYLSIHNDDDDAVPWYQGIEFFSALRRLGKEAYMFNYNGEKHGLRERENQKHWTVHQDEFFDHFLLGKPRPEWMEQGVPYLERGQRDVGALYKAPEAKEEKKEEKKEEIAASSRG